VFDQLVQPSEIHNPLLSSTSGGSLVARTHGRIYTTIWADLDFRRLGKDPQRAYLMLLSQPQINNCGVLPYVQRKWAKLAIDETDQELDQALGALVDSRFIVLDEQTDELLIRTFIRHDRIQAQPNLEKSARRQFTEIESRAIRRALLSEYPKLFNDLATEDLHEPLPEPLWKDLPDETPSESPSRARDRTRTAPAPSPTPAPTPEVRDEEAVEPSRATLANGLPFEKEQHVEHLLAAIGTHADDGTPGVIRAYARRLPEGALAKVLESIQQQNPDDRAAYVVAALKDELPPDPGSPIAKLEREPEAYVRQLGFKLPDDVLQEKLEQLVPDDQDERIRLHDLAADLRSAAA
jgi:hypothetical protein